MHNLDKPPQNFNFCGGKSKFWVRKMKTRAECLKEYGSDYMIQKKIDAGELFKVGKGIYSDDKFAPELAVLSYRFPDAVVTMRNAFYMHDLTDVIPDGYDLSTDRNAYKISDKDVKQYFEPSDFFEQGIETMDYKGYPVRIYSKERMLIELLRYKNKLPYDYYKEILRNFRTIMPQLDIQAIQDYAYKAPKSEMIMKTLQAEVL